MKHTILKYGGYSLITAIILFLLGLLFGKGIDYTSQEIIGYVTMVVSLSFIFFGIKHYRDKVNNGTLSFAKSLSIGLLIAVMAGLGIAIADFIYTTWINPDFMSEYSEHMLNTMEQTLSAEEFALKKKEFETQMESMGSPIMLATLMFATVFIIGLIISLLSSLILQRKPQHNAV